MDFNFSSFRSPCPCFFLLGIWTSSNSLEVQQNHEKGDVSIKFRRSRYMLREEIQRATSFRFFLKDLAKLDPSMPLGVVFKLH